MRYRMSEDRYQIWLLFMTHKTEDIDIDTVIDRLSKTKNRKLDFIFFFKPPECYFIITINGL